MTKTQVAQGRDIVRANAAKARASALRARVQARQAASQVAPAVASAKTTAQQGVHSARIWTAPQLDRAAAALQDRVAPKVAVMLITAARRIEPPKPKRRVWPVALAAGLAAAAGAAAAGVLTGRQGKGPLAGRLGKSPEGSSGSQGEPEAADASTADVNGRVHAS
jgi:hypothetical protein